MKKTISLLFLCILIFSLVLSQSLFLPLVSCGEKKKSITIYATCEDVRFENVQKMLTAQFPEYDIRLQYKSTGELAAKLANEGTQTNCDIVFDLENTYMEKLGENLAVLDGLPGVDFDVYLSELVPSSHRYIPLIRTSGAIVINEKMLSEKGLSLPTCYDDLLKPEYKGLISMPNPKASGTGYVFYLSMVNSRGQEAALTYFDALASNLSGSGFTSSGAGPIKALKLGTAAIGLCMTWQAVSEINSGADYRICYFEEGAPFNAYSSAIIAGKETDQDIQKVFAYLVSDVTPKDKELFAPEPIYKDKTYTIENFPSDIRYADMTGLQDITVKDKLLDAWKY